MSEPEWNSTTTPEEGAAVYVLATDNRGQYVIPFLARIMRRFDRYAVNTTRSA